MPKRRNKDLDENYTPFFEAIDSGNKPLILFFLELANKDLIDMTEDCAEDGDYEF